MDHPSTRLAVHWTWCCGGRDCSGHGTAPGWREQSQGLALARQRRATAGGGTGWGCPLGLAELAKLDLTADNAAGTSSPGPHSARPRARPQERSQTRTRSCSDPAWGGHRSCTQWSRGADFGGNATVIGASANVVVASMSESRGHRIGFGQYLRYGVPATLVTMLVATGDMLIRTSR